MKKDRKFNFRAFVSLYTLISFLLISFSGIVLYFSPPGRVANWSYWNFLGLYKSEWQALHTIFTFIFILAISFHLFFNWKPVIFYIKSKVQSVLKINRELTGAFVLALIIFVMTVNSLPPFSYIMDAGEELSNSWSNASTEPPVPHAELLNISDFSKTIGKDKSEVVSRLSAKNIRGLNDTIRIAELAELNNLTPQQIYNFVSAEGKHITGAVTGRGLGRKSLADVCNENGIDINTAISFLQQNGIESGKDETIKDIAQRADKLPFEIVDLILSGKKSSAD